ncbi:NADH pyrophosphatase, partial [Rhodospirillum rubrum]|nr:NADH pyrophosphatase [Rhodospirillum rubrum]
MAQTGISDIVYTQARHDRVSTGTLDDKALEALGWRPEARWLVFWRGRIAFPATGPTPDPTREPGPLSPLLLDGPTVRG